MFGFTPSDMKNFWLIVLSGLTLFIIGYSMYNFFVLNGNDIIRNVTINSEESSTNIPVDDNQVSNISPTAKPTAFVLDDSVYDPEQTYSESEVRSIIVNSIFSEQYQDLVPYMVFEPEINILGSECCGNIRNSDAATQLQTINGGGTWSFVDADERIQRLKVAAPELFRNNNAIVGVSSLNYAVSFQLNRKFQIDTIVVSKDFNEIF